MPSPSLVRSDWDARVWFGEDGPFERRLEVTPTIAGWDHLSFRSYTFRAGQSIDGESASDEMTMLLLSGSITMEIDGPGGKQVWELDGRTSAFDGPPFAIYLPPHHGYRTVIQRDADCCYGRAPARGALPPRLFHPSDLQSITTAEGLRRTTIFRAGDTEHLRCQETIIPAGQWSVVNDDRPDVQSINQVTYFQTDPQDGWGLQHIVGRDGAEAVLVQHGDAVFMRGASHAVVASPESRLAMLTYQAGPTGAWPE